MSAKPKQNDTPIFGEILDSDLLYGYSNIADLSVVGLASVDPSALWAQLKINPWLAMLVYEDMESKDDVIASALDTRKDGVLAKSRQVLPASENAQDRKVAEFVGDTLDGCFIRSGERYSGLNQILWEILDAVGKGVSIGEIIFGDGGDRINIEDVKFKPQGLFTFGEGVTVNSYLGSQSGPLRLRASIGIPGVAADGMLPQDKFLVASYRPRHGNRWGSPLDRKVFWPSYFRRAGMKQYLRYLEKGPGSVVARYADAASSDEKHKALDAARAVNEETAVALPSKFQIEVMEHVRQSMGTSYESFDESWANAIMRVILGQTLTSRGSEGGGGSRALGDVHQQVRAEKIESDAKFLMYVVNTYMVKPIVRYNFGPSTELPLWVIKYDPKRDQSADSVVHERLVGMGVEIPKKFIYQEYQIPEPAEGEEVLEPPEKAPGDPATGVDPAADFAEKKNSAEQVEADIEQQGGLEDRALLEAAPIYDGIFERVINEIESRSDVKLPDQFFDNLDNEFDSLVDPLASGLLASYLLGLDQVKARSEQVAISFADPIELGFDVAPSEAIDYFKRKRVVTSTQFKQLSEDARSAAFSVAGVYRQDVLEGFKSEIVGALETGAAQGKVIKRFREILAGAGHRELGAFHLETVFRTNMQMAYGVGRRKALEEVASDLPQWQYHTAGDDRVRPAHAVLNGIILPANHEFWSAHFPPWDFNCRCSITAMDSIPAGYDHSNPSGLGEITYGSRGNPAKAEYETSVIDLAAAGQLPGIPPQGGLRTVIETGVKRTRKAKKTKPDRASSALGTPVSQALTASGGRGFPKRASKIMEIIDRIHGDGNLPRIPFVRERFTGWIRNAYGAYKYDRVGAARGIYVNTNTDDIEFTAAHEIGHFLDHHGISTQGQFASEALDARMAEWRKAIEQSSAVKRLKELQQQRIVMNAQGVPVMIPQRHLQYLLDPTELWARSYSQFIAQRSGDPVLLKQLDSSRQQNPARLYLPSQWGDDDFREISRAIEGLLKVLGWMK